MMTYCIEIEVVIDVWVFTHSQFEYFYGNLRESVCLPTVCMLAGSFIFIVHLDKWHPLIEFHEASSSVEEMEFFIKP